MWAMTGRKSNTLSPAQPQIFLLLPSLQECLVEQPGATDSWLAQTFKHHGHSVLTVGHTWQQSSTTQLCGSFMHTHMEWCGDLRQK